MGKLLILLFLLCGPPIWAQTSFANLNSEEVTLIYEGETLYAAANTTVPWFNAPQGEFIAYVYTKANYADLDLVKKIGFVRFENKHDSIAFSKEPDILPIYITNLQTCEVVIEYGQNSVFIGPGSTSWLPNYYVSPSYFSTIFWTSYCQEELADEVQSKLIKFRLTKDGLKADL